MTSQKEHTLIAIGWYHADRPRHWVIETGLREHGYTMIHCNTEQPGFFKKYCDLWKQFWKHHHEASVILVPFQGHYVMPLAWLLGVLSRKPVVFDVFISLYDTNVIDRKLVPKYSPKAWFLFFLDWLSCFLATQLLIDTQHHKQYFVESYRIRPKKICVVPVGAHIGAFKPAEHEKEPNPNECIVAFWGTFIPLQGIDVILHAAAHVQQHDTTIQFQLIGGGQTAEDMWNLAQELKLQNTAFISPMPSREELAQYIHKADICLGIFAHSDKTMRVIPHKAYDTLACKKPLISAHTPAAAAELDNGNDVLFTEVGNPEDLAEKILLLSKDSEKRRTIAENGYAVFQKKFMPDTVVQPLVAWLDSFHSAS